MINYMNYFLVGKTSRLIRGHLKSKDLYSKILNHDGSTAFCCYFDLDESLLKLEWDTGEKDSDGKILYEYLLNGQKPKNPASKCNGKSFAKYEGIARPALGCISFDFDSDDLDASLADVRRFVEWLDVEDIAVFFSGGKGFHIMVPANYFPLEPNEHLPNQLKDLAKYLKDIYPTLDDGIYNYNRKFRVPFSKHDKTGLYKTLIDTEYLMSCDMDDILEAAEHPSSFDFLADIDIDKDRAPLAVIAEAIENSKRKSYAIEKDRAGTYEEASPFEKYDGKLCIKKMLESRCDDIGRNNACMRIVNDFYRTGAPQATCEKDVYAWAQLNGLPISEASTIIGNIYLRGGNYNFGCQDECKSVYCSAKCSIWKKLDPEKRPITVDMPSDDRGKMKGEFHGVTWLMERIFGCDLNESTGTFKQGLIVKQDATHLFYYKDNHWQALDESKIHILKTKLNSNFENKLGIRKLDSVFKLFTLYVPERPEDLDMLAPRKDMANFLDGTLHLVRDDKGQFKLDFRQHTKLDFCTTMIEQRYKDYLANPDRENKAFESWLMEYLNNDEDSFKLVQEMFGASIMPKFPQFFILLGLSGTGKSTTIKVLKKLHKNEKNICGVAPHHFNGFNMSSMVGKLMNIVSDIKTNCAIDDDLVKQVDDQEPVRIEVKKKDDVYTTLPALHIFGANKMPKTGEGYSGAMGRRFSIVNFDKVFKGKKNTEIAADMFNADPLGVFCFAMRGLNRLVSKNNGEYTKTEKSQHNVKEWSKESDIVSTFIGELSEDKFDLDGKAYQLCQAPNEKINRGLMWKLFQKWQEDGLDARQQMGKMTFFNLLKNAGFVDKRSADTRYILGVGELTPSDETI